MEHWETVPRLKEIHIQPGHTVDENESLGAFVDKIKSQKSSTRTYVVLRGKKPVGIIRSVDMFRLLGTLFGVALNYKKRLTDVMYLNFITLDWNTRVDEVSRKAMERPYEDIYDDIIVTNEQGDFFGVVPIYELLGLMTEVRVKEAVQQNPLTGLPGNEKINEYVSMKINENVPFSVVYIDIDHFKAYNDVYGFKYGDDVIKWVGNLLLQLSKPHSAFVGHVGGDDFVACLDVESAISYCQEVIQSFEETKSKFYTAEDFSKNYIDALDRSNQAARFPLICLSLAVIHIYSNEELNISDISLYAAKLKKQAKQELTSNIVQIRLGEMNEG